MNVRFPYASLLAIFIALFFAQAQIRAELSPSYDVVVYGATPSGIIAAYAVAREGEHVVLLEPSNHLGGMVTGGLSATDVGNFSVIGGYPRRFFARAAAHDGVSNLDAIENWRSEPHVAEAAFLDMLKEAGVEVRFHERLREGAGVLVDRKRIVSIATEDGHNWTASVFIDCTYEGDLMAQSHVLYTWGREAEQEYGESLAGVRASTPKHQFTWPMSPYDQHHALLPEVAPGPLASPGSADKKVESYNFRPILTNDPANRIPFPRPDGYNPASFALLDRYLSQFQRQKGRLPELGDFFIPVPLPNHKADFNNNGPISTDYIGHSYAYPEASYAQRQRIWQQHLVYTQSLFYFLSHDASVPAPLRAQMNQWGLPRDEFADTDHWPDQLYVREARRMIGAYVLRQSDLQQETTKPDSIGMGSYNIDSHNIQRVALPNGAVTNEGDVEVPVQPYEIPYRSLVPQRSQVQNLLVPVCLSATHVAYSSVRMEPQYMILGQAAGEAAALAVRQHVAVQDISIEDLQHQLRRHGAILHRSQLAPTHPASVDRSRSTPSRVKVSLWR